MSDRVVNFNLDDLIASLRAAATGQNAASRIKSILEEVVSLPERVSEGIPEFKEEEVVLFEDDSVSIWYCRFLPGTEIPPHDHQMLATIAVYQGTERNSFYQVGADGGISQEREIELSAGSVMQIEPSVIHSVSCASTEPCCGIHVYLGKLTTVNRSLFDAQTGETLPFTDSNYQRLTRAGQTPDGQ